MSEPLHPTEMVAIGPDDVLASRYVVQARLGAGGMGVVYRVLDRDLDEPIALKILHAEQAWSADAVARFRREVKLARKVTHPNVARTFDLGRHGPLFFLTMELIEGGSLAERMRSPIPLSESLRVAIEVCRGLAAAHAQGVVHRDLKPENIMLSGDRVVITDFGVARDAGDTRATSGGIVGTPAYMAPEQLGERTLDGRADVYALGIVLYELVTGALPFHGDTPFAMAAARLGTPPPDPRAVVPSVPEGIARLILDALAQRREDRLDAQALAERLDVLRGARPAPRAVTPDALSATEFAIRSENRTLRIDPLDADAPHAGLARDLTTALRDALASERGVKIVASGGDLTVAGEVRVASSRARLRVRTLASDGTITWSSRIEGDPADPFALEDRVVDEVTQALRARSGTRRGPRSTALRERWERAMEQLRGIDPVATREGIEALEQMHREDANDPNISAALALALVHLWIQTAGMDPSISARAEELAVRALDADPHLADACFAMARIRMVTGDVRAGVRGLRETLALAPAHSDAQFGMGTILFDAGFVDEGMRRLDIARRLGAAGGSLLVAEIRGLLLTGRVVEAESRLASARKGPHVSSLVPFMTEACTWTSNRAMAAEAAALMRAAPTGGSWEAALPLVDAEGRGETSPALLAEALAFFDAVTSAPSASWYRSLVARVSAGHIAFLGGHGDDVLRFVELAAAQAACIDLTWFDRVPFLGPLRGEPRFASARAIVATRVAELGL